MAVTCRIWKFNKIWSVFWLKIEKKIAIQKSFAHNIYISCHFVYRECKPFHKVVSSYSLFIKLVFHKLKLYSFLSFTLSSSSKKEEEKNLLPRNIYSRYNHLSPVVAGELNVRKYILKALYLFERKIKLLMLAWHG